MHVGDFRVVLRAADDERRQLLLECFRRYVVEEHSRRPANFSLRLSDDPNTFHTLHRGSCLVLASPDPSRVLTALVRHLDALAPRDGSVATQALAVVERGEVTLVPTLLEDDLRALGRRMERSGLALDDVPYVRLDLETGQVIVPPHLEIDQGASARLSASAPPPRRPDPPVPEGRYPLKRWLFMDYWQPPGPYSRATATRRAALLVRGGPSAAGPGVLDRLATLFSHVAAEGIDPSGREDTMRLLGPTR